MTTLRYVSAWLALGLAVTGIAHAHQPAASSAQSTSPVMASAASMLPFSFVYDGKASRDLLPQWAQRRTVQHLTGNRERDVVTWRDEHTGLQVVFEKTIYH